MFRVFVAVCVQPRIRCAKLPAMTALFAQTVSSEEWHDGWQLVMIAVGLAVTLVIAVIGWLHKQSKEGISDLRTESKEGISELRTESKEGISDLRTESKEGISDLKSDMKERFNGVDNRLDDLGNGIKGTQRRIDKIYHLLLSQSIGSTTQQTLPGEQTEHTAAESERMESVTTSASEMAEIAQTESMERVEASMPLRR